MNEIKHAKIYSKLLADLNNTLYKNLKLKKQRNELKQALEFIANFDNDNIERCHAFQAYHKATEALKRYEEIENEFK